MPTGPSLLSAEAGCCIKVAPLPHPWEALQAQSFMTQVSSAATELRSALQPPSFMTQVLVHPDCSLSQGDGPSQDDNIQSTGVVDREFIGKSTETTAVVVRLIWHLGGSRRLQNTLRGCGNDLPTLWGDFRCF